MATKLLFSETSQRFYFFVENELTILLFWVSCGYDFTDEQKESGGTGVISSDAAFFCLSRFALYIHCQSHELGGEVDRFAAARCSTLQRFLQQNSRTIPSSQVPLIFGYLRYPSSASDGRGSIKICSLESTEVK